MGKSTLGVFERPSAREQGHKERIIEKYENAIEAEIYVLTDFVGDELEILDPYGGDLSVYGLCYETLRKSLKKLVKKLESVREEGESHDDKERGLH